MRWRRRAPTPAPGTTLRSRETPRRVSHSIRRWTEAVTHHRDSARAASLSLEGSMPSAREPAGASACAVRSSSGVRRLVRNYPLAYTVRVDRGARSQGFATAAKGGPPQRRGFASTPALQSAVAYGASRGTRGHPAGAVARVDAHSPELELPPWNSSRNVSVLKT